MENLNFLLKNIPIASVIAAVVIPVILYWYVTRNQDYWKKRGIPYAKAIPLLGNPPGLFNKTFEQVELERYEKFGKIYGYFEGRKPVIVVAKPELLRDILVKDFQSFTTRRIFNSGDSVVDNMLSLLNGEDWKRVRTIVSPTFTTGKIKKVMSIFQDCAKTLLQNFKMESARGKNSDVVRTYGAFTMDVIASSAFSTKLNSHNDPNNEFVKNAKAAFRINSSLIFILFILMPKVLNFFRIGAFADNMIFFKKATLDIIAERKRTGQTRNDFLQLLLDTAKEELKEESLDDKSEDIIANYVDESANHPVFKNTPKQRLSMDELVAQCVIFFIAGYHTSATTLSMVTYLLALNPDIQDKVFKEIKDVLSETDGELMYESVQKMKYLDNVISETMRIYSPAIRLERTADSDYKLGDTGITIPKGMVVGIPVFAMHRDPSFFPEPMKFDPNRFNPEEREKQIPYTYLPFGAGPRNCVGMRFALLEVKVCLIYVFSAFQAKKCSSTEVPLKFQKSTGLISPESVTLFMEPRKECPLKS